MDFFKSFVDSQAKRKTQPKTGGLLSGLSAGYKPLTLNKTTPSSPSALNPTLGTQITTLNGQQYNSAGQPIGTSPAKTNYMNSVTAQAPQQARRPAPQPTGSPQQAPAPQPTGSPQQAPAPQPTGSPSQNTDFLKAYRDYLSQYGSSLKPSAETEKAALDSANLAGQMDERSLKARREYESTLDTPGMLKAGAEESAKQGRFRSDQNLADLGIQQSSADRRLLALQGIDSARTGGLKTAMELSKPIKIGDKFFDPATGADITSQLTKAEKEEKEQGFSLSEGQSRFERDPATGKLVKVASVGKTFAPEKGGGGGIGNEGDFKSQAAATGRQAVSTMLSIANKNPGIFGKTASLPIPNAMRSDAFRNYEAQIDALKGNIIPAALTAMREASKTGGALGQVSDREGAWLASALGALNMNQSSTAIVEQLQQIDASLERWENALAQSGGSTPPSSEEDELAALGYSPEQIAQIKAAQ